MNILEKCWAVNLPELKEDQYYRVDIYFSDKDEQIIEITRKRNALDIINDCLRRVQKDWADILFEARQLQQAPDIFVSEVGGQISGKKYQSLTLECGHFFVTATGPYELLESLLIIIRPPNPTHDLKEELQHLYGPAPVTSTT